MANPGKLDRFDSHIPREPWVNPWQPDGTYRSDTTLLERLLGIAVGTSQQSGIVAAASDVWAAEELRRAGFDPDAVWPRRTAPRVLPRDVRNFVNSVSPKTLREQVEARYNTPGARRALPAEAHVMGRAFSKQSDVVIASWAAGVEVLVSTKTMLSSYQKNLRNRFEEGYGDAKNLRGRHPLASLGFLFIAGSDIPETSLTFAIDMLRKLTSEPDVYDCACLLVVHGALGAVEDDIADDRPVEDEPPSLLDISPQPEESPMSESDQLFTTTLPATASPTTVQLNRVPDDLGPNRFFETLITRALDRMPIAVYPEVRERRASARE